MVWHTFRDMTFHEILWHSKSSQDILWQNILWYYISLHNLLWHNLPPQDTIQRHDISRSCDVYDIISHHKKQLQWKSMGTNSKCKNWNMFPLEDGRVSWRAVDKWWFWRHKSYGHRSVSTSNVIKIKIRELEGALRNYHMLSFVVNNFLGILDPDFYSLTTGLVINRKQNNDAIDFS